VVSVDYGKRSRCISTTKDLAPSCEHRGATEHAIYRLCLSARRNTLILAA
jgi:hypothetical protein